LPAQHSTALIEKSSDQLVPPGLEGFEGEGVGRQLRVERADDGLVAVRQKISSRDDIPDMQRDRSAFGSEDGGRSFDRSSPPPGDGRQFVHDLGRIAASREAQVPSESAVLSVRSKSLVDQVAEQISAIALVSGRNEARHVQVRLHPQALGPLAIEVSWQKDGIVAAIKAQSDVAGELLAHDLGRLKTALGEQGIPVSSLGVQIGLDLRQWSYEGDGAHASAHSGSSPEAAHGRDRRSALPMGPVMEPDRLIDITV
jgi:hypothetical protein